MPNIVSKVKDILSRRGGAALNTWPKKERRFDRCQYYNNVTVAKRIVMQNIFHVNERYKNDVTLISQTSLDRLETVNRLVQSWNGPVSLAVHVTPFQTIKLSYYLSKLRRKHSIRLHLVIDLDDTVCIFCFLCSDEMETESKRGKRRFYDCTHLYHYHCHCHYMTLISCNN